MVELFVAGTALVTGYRLLQSKWNGNGKPLYATNGKTVHPRNGKPASAGNGQPVATRNGKPAPARNGKPAPASNGEAVPTRNGKPASASNGQPVPARNGQPAPARNGKPPSARNGKPQLIPVAGSRRELIKSMSSDAAERERELAEHQINRKLITAIGSLGLAVAGALVHPPLALLSLPGLVYASRDVFAGAYRSLKKRKVNVDCMSALVKVLFVAQGHLVFASVTVVLYAFNRKLLNKIKDSSRKSLVDVFRQQPTTVWLWVDGAEIEIPFAQLQRGNVVVVRAGETIPVDGQVVSGMAAVDQHVLTGESHLIEKGAGDEVFAATVVLSGRVLIRVDKAGQETNAARIGQVLNQTADMKTDQQLWVESASDRTVLPTLLLSAGVWPVLGPTAALTILNVHFKYRMTLVTSLGMLNFLNLAARKGLLIKDGRAFERLNRVDVIVFDKTGTLTEDQLQVVGIETCDGYRAVDILRWAAAAEERQTHPLAIAIRRAAAEQELDVPEVAEAALRVGFGLTVTVEDRLIRLGSTRFMAAEGIAVPPQIAARQEASRAVGNALVLVAVDSEIAGAIELEPTVRPDAKAVVKSLQRRGMPTFIVSGDEEAPTRQLAAELNIDHYYAEVTPEGKSDIVARLQAAGKVVCFIGDGINDSVAMKKADVSISLRGASTVATDTAQVILMDGRLHQVVDLFELAEEFEPNVKMSAAAVIAPMLAGMAGAVIGGFGLVHSAILNQVGLAAGAANASLPLLKHRGENTGLVRRADGLTVNPPPSTRLLPAPTEGRTMSPPVDDVLV